MSDVLENPLKKLTKSACFSITGSDPVVLKACMKYAARAGSYFICEATVNQVNQFGGYTGMKPADYADMVRGFAEEVGFPQEKIILCGDHLGPFTWQHLESSQAMEYSRELVRSYVKAGFRKIHLDTTMPLAGDDVTAFGDALITERAVELAKISEDTYQETKDETIWNYPPVYVIGSEVPVPGGSQVKEAMEVTRPENLKGTLDSFREAFCGAGLERVWQETVAVVAQIGLEFSEDNVYDFVLEKALPLGKALKDYPGLCFESHSSDYQTPANLQDMVKSGVGILKVGPELTFAHREALFSLSMIEEELQPVYGYTPSSFREVLDQEMLEGTPDYWRKYYHGSDAWLRIKRQFSYSDRCRYYFARPKVVEAERRLLENLSNIQIPLYLISQYMPIQYDHIREGQITANPQDLLDDRIQAVMKRYYENMLKAVESKTC